MKATIHYISKLALGWLLVFLGVIGWFLPVVPGTLLFLLGVAILSAQSEWIREKIESLKARFPRQAARLRALREGLTKTRKAEPS